MSVITTVTTALGGGAMGALFGALGSLLNRGVGIIEAREKRKDRTLEMAHEKERWGHDIALHGQAMEGQARASLAEQALADVRGSWGGLTASLDADARVEASYPWVAAVRALTRPGLTLLLWLMFGLVLLFGAAGALPDETSAGMIQSAVETLSFSASTALAWWFGDRIPRRREP